MGIDQTLAEVDNSTNVLCFPMQRLYTSRFLLELKELKIKINRNNKHHYGS